jgi:hypothetical protein
MEENVVNLFFLLAIGIVGVGMALIGHFAAIRERDRRRGRA